MALSARDRRIFSEIERDFIAAEPRLAHARGRRGWAGGLLSLLLSLLLSGIALLVIGLVLHMAVLIWAGVPLTQLGPVLAIRVHRRAHGRALRDRPASGAAG